MQTAFTADDLNQVAKLLGTNDKNVVFSAVLASLVEMGLKMSEAFDLLFGEGSYKAFAGEIYHALRAKAAQ